MVLFAAGREGSTSGLNLDACGLEADGRGRLEVDRTTFQTSVPHIYAAGDVIGFQYGSNPVRYAYHRIFQGSVADGSGRTGLVTVIPAVRPGVSPNAPVTLQQPVVKAVLQTAEYGATSGKLSEGGRFEWVQTLS